VVFPQLRAGLVGVRRAIAGGGGSLLPARIPFLLPGPPSTRVTRCCFTARRVKTVLCAPRSQPGGGVEPCFEYPHLRYSGFSAALEEIAASVTAPLPVVKGDGGPYWEDGAYSDAQTAGLARENEQRALSAEKIATVSSLPPPARQGRPAVVKHIWEKHPADGMKHTWGAWLSNATPDHAEAVAILAGEEIFRHRSGAGKSRRCGIAACSPLVTASTCPKGRGLCSIR